MKALDTHALVRFLVQDDIKQSEKVNQLFTRAEQSKQPLLVTSLVVLELIWVLDAVYSVDRNDIIHALNELLTMPVIEFENQGMLRSFVNVAQDSNLDLSDILIAQSGFIQGCDGYDNI